MKTLRITCTEVDPYGFKRREKSSLAGTKPQEEDNTSESSEGEIVKVSVTLKPKHKQWIKDQDFGLSEWVRNHIDEEIKEETDAGGKSDEEKNSGSSEEKKKAKREGVENNSLPADHTCSICGEEKATTKVVRNGKPSYLCSSCMEKMSGESAKKEKKRSGNSDSDSNQPCAVCGEVKDSVKEVPMGPGRGKKPLCRICGQEMGLRLGER